MATSSKPLQLSVVIYIPQKGNYYHWALDIQNRLTKAHTIFQVEGEENQLEPTRNDGEPDWYSRLLKQIVIGHIRESDLAVVAQTVKAVPIQNEVVSWDCQEYVIEIMDALEEMGLLGGLGKYEAVKRAVKGMRGDMDSTHAAVVNYDYATLREEEDLEEEDDDDDSDLEDDTEEEEEEEAPKNVRSAARVDDSDED